MEARYSVIKEKDPREIVLLRGIGCGWRKCRFCDYHLDFCKDPNENFLLNRQVLTHVTGCYGKLEVINSGSFPELDPGSFFTLEQVCKEKQIRQLYFESHWRYREMIPLLKSRLSSLGITVKLKIGVETFNVSYREKILRKGMGECTPKEIASFFQQVCLLQGLAGQSESSMIQDIEIGLQYFERVCVNLMNSNTTAIAPDPTVVKIFINNLLPVYQKNPRVDILLHNTDFGVGAGT